LIDCLIRGVLLAVVVVNHVVPTLTAYNSTTVPPGPNNNYDRVFGAVIMTKAIARVHPVHLFDECRD